MIAYSFYYGGEYDRILKAVKEEKEITDRECSNAITIMDDDYPSSFLDLEYPPFVIFYKGDKKLLKRRSIAIVGSRMPCEYALKATKTLSLHYKDSVIVSGMAKGIDACAHVNAKQTIGVLGCGIDYIYPACNRDLFTKVSAEGLIISEYPGLTRPYAGHFPFRNRLIAALAERIYIMQSSVRSGTMTTLNAALELQKEIRVLPYDIFCPEGFHNNRLIYEGAQPILSEEIAF